jgi:hypothetical protein
MSGDQFNSIDSTRSRIRLTDRADQPCEKAYLPLKLTSSPHHLIRLFGQYRRQITHVPEACFASARTKAISMQPPAPQQRQAAARV